MARPVNVNAVVYFEAVARHSRVNLAAEELMVSPSAVSQQIKTLEEQLGVLLFRRIKRRLVLTEEGERYYASASTALKLLRDAQARASRKLEYHRLMIRVSPTLGVRWLGRRISDYISQHPNVDLHVDATSELTDFEKEKVDLEIRYGPNPPDGYHAQILLEDRVLPLCAPKLAEQAQTMPPEEVLASTRLIHTVKAFGTWREWLDRNGMTGVDDKSGLRFDRSSMSLEAARDGIGVVFESATLAVEELRSGSLVPFLPKAGSLTFPAYWIVCPSRHLNRRAVKAFVSWVEGHAREHDAEIRRVLSLVGASDEAPYLDRD